MDRLALVREFWNETPCDGQATYASRAQFRYSKEPWLLPVLERIAATHRHILEVGCGQGTDGVTLCCLLSPGSEYVGVDLSEASLVNARHAAGEMAARLRVDARFELDNAEALSFPSARFDAVVSIGALHHSPQTARALSEVHRVLQPGGVAYVFLYRMLSPKLLGSHALRGVQRGLDAVLRTERVLYRAVKGSRAPGRTVRHHDLRVFRGSDSPQLYPSQHAGTFREFFFGSASSLWRRASSRGRVPRARSPAQQSARVSLAGRSKEVAVLPRVAYAALILSVVFVSLVVLHKSVRALDIVPYLEVDDSIPNVAVTLAEHGRYGFLSSPTQGTREVDRTHAFYNYGPLYFYVASAAVWLAGPSLLLFRLFHPAGLIVIVALWLWTFRRVGVAGRGSLRNTAVLDLLVGPFADCPPRYRRQRVCCPDVRLHGRRHRRAPNFAVVGRRVLCGRSGNEPPGRERGGRSSRARVVVEHARGVRRA